MKKNFLAKEEPPIRLRYYFLGSVVLWSILIGLSLVWNLRIEKSGILEAARIEARAGFDKDVVYRRWNAGFGGVYAPVTEVTQPNPYLDVLERDITTSLGMELTKINPAYMTRQVHELALKAYGIRGHITSLDPIRPANAPDPWETRALKAFQTGLKEASSVEEIEGSKYMRLMRPLLTEQSCLQCHAAQGYKLGDIRGGISVSTPMAPFMAIAQSHIFALGVGHGLLWLAGLVGIGFGFRRLNQQIHKRIGVEVALWEKRHDLDERVKDLNCLYGISNLVDNPGISLEEILQGTVDLIPPSWQYPAITCSRIILESGEYRTKNFKKTSWGQVSDIKVDDQPTGKLEVYYLEEKPESHEGPFLKEERLLINAVAERLGKIVEHRQSEEALRKAHDELEQRVRERTSELANANDGLKQEINERKQAEEALRESEEKYRTILESIEEAYFEVDIAGNFIFFNDSLSKSLGYSNDELMGMNNRDYMSPEASKKIYNLFNQIYRTGNPIKKETYEIIRKDGVHGFHEMSASLMKNQAGQPIGFRGIAHDITEVKKVGDALRESKDNLDKAQEIAHIGNWSRDLKTDQGHWSDEMYRILDLAPRSPDHPTHEEFLSRVHPDDREYTDSEMKKAVEEKGSFDFEFRTVPIKGSERIIHSRGEVECDEAGVPVRKFGINQDITETRRLQAQLQKSQKMEVIATLAGGVAHEFNNALMGIMGNIELLEMDLPKDEGRGRYFEAMKSSGHRMSRLTDQLLAYSEGGKYEPKNLKLDDFAIETLPILQHDLSPEVRVETHFSKDISYVKADHAQMQMLLSAILANSNEAIEDGGLIKITAGNEDLDEDFTKKYPDLSLKPCPYVCLTIEDDGKGMDVETTNRIFDPFFTTKFQGRGMGMAAVYGIVKNHDGWIFVDSELGKGTVVKIYLPAVEAEEEVEEGVVLRPTAELAMGEGTILVIEDEEPLMELFRQVLERLGYRVLKARTGKEAVEFAKTFDGQIDLALLDIKLPDMDGGRVYPLIMEARPDLKVIVCSGYSIDGPARAILDAGAEGFIQKPFSIAAFAEKLKEVLEGK